jgi:hypothetical protein
MGMPKEPNDFLIDAAPTLLEACREALQAFRLLQLGQRPPYANEEYCTMLEAAIAEAEGR